MLAGVSDPLPEGEGDLIDMFNTAAAEIKKKTNIAKAISAISNKRLDDNLKSVFKSYSKEKDASQFVESVAAAFRTGSYSNFHSLILLGLKDNQHTESKIYSYSSIHLDQNFSTLGVSIEST